MRQTLSRNDEHECELDPWWSIETTIQHYCLGIPAAKIQDMPFFQHGEAAVCRCIAEKLKSRAEKSLVMNSGCHFDI